MRVLGKLSDGSVGFVKYTEANLPRNKAYLVVPAGSPDEIRMEVASSGIADISADSKEATIRVNGLDIYVEGAEITEIYSITGQLIARGNGNGPPFSPRTRTLYRQGRDNRPQNHGPLTHTQASTLDRIIGCLKTLKWPYDFMTI